MEPNIIFEDENFLAIDKPVGMMVHRVKISSKKKSNKINEPTLVDWLLSRYPELKKVGDDLENRPGIVHRLDKDTSGVILIPKTQEYFLYLKKLFQEHKIKKTYLAIVCGAPKEKEGTITKPIGIKDGTIKRSVHSKKHAKDAITYYRVLKSIAVQEESNSKPVLLSLIEVSPQTGRTHQIRVHLSSIGYPILGDTLYGNKISVELSKKLHINHQMLHAQMLEFGMMPNSKIVIETKPPEEFLNYFK